MLKSMSLPTFAKINFLLSVAWGTQDRNEIKLNRMQLKTVTFYLHLSLRYRGVLRGLAVPALWL